MAFGQSVTPSEVEGAIAEKVILVPEFKFIRAEAEKLGVKVYLFGGTAAGFANYVRNDLLRSKGDANFQGERFDYDFTNIFRSTQDLDIVVDGSSEKIERLKNTLRTKFPHFIGTRGNKWEVRSLRESKGRANEIGYKEALLGSPDFLNQNSDSSSTGLVQVTKAAPEEVVIDLRDMDRHPSRFSSDVAKGELTFLRSRSHFSTPRAAAGRNPEIFAVVRALTKAMQYDLRIKPEDLREMKEIVDAFDPKEIALHPDNKRRLIESGIKIFMHATDVERAWNTTEALGLREKLMQFDRASELGSLAWWMNKEPLRSKPPGEGSGKTAFEIARERGLTELVVAHETGSFLALESIERSHKGVPNFFISRRNAPGEAAVHGPGTYAQIGRTGARGTGLTVRMIIDPRARLGSDFEMVGEYVILNNRNAARTIPESWHLSPTEYLETIAKSADFDFGDKGLREKLQRRLKNQSNNLSTDERKTIRTLFESSNTSGKLNIIAEMSRLGMPIDFDRTELTLLELVKLQQMKFNLIKSNSDNNTKNVVSLARKLALAATTWEHLESALDPYLYWGEGINGKLGNYLDYYKEMNALTLEMKDKVIKLALESRKFHEATTLFQQLEELNEFREFFAKQVTTSAELVQLGRWPIHGKATFDGASFLRTQVDRHLELNPTPNDNIEFLKQQSFYNRLEVAEKILPRIRTVQEYLTVLDSGWEKFYEGYYGVWADYDKLWREY
ncbi:MAG: hypothetical protein V4760_00920, partial [Bdellovibrionota bacterium]